MSFPGQSSAPPGTVIVGTYHTHTASEDFNATDLNTIRNGKPQVPGFLITPMGKILMFDPGRMITPDDIQRWIAEMNAAWFFYRYKSGRVEYYHWWCSIRPQDILVQGGPSNAWGVDLYYK